MEEKKKPRRHKPGWGRVFSNSCRYQDDPIYWKLYDLVMLRDPKAVFNIKGPHRTRPNNNFNIGKEKKKNGNTIEGQTEGEVGSLPETDSPPVQSVEENS